MLIKITNQDGVEGRNFCDLVREQVGCLVTANFTNGLVKWNRTKMFIPQQHREDAENNRPCEITLQDFELTIEQFDYAGSKPEVHFQFNGQPMFAELDPGVVQAVVVRGTAEGFNKHIEFDQYDALQKTINWMTKK